MTNVHKLFRLLLPGLVLLVSLGCGFATPVAPPTSPPTAMPLNQATEPSDEKARESSESEAGCEEYFRFCVTSTVSGAVSATATGGVGHSGVDNCTAWAQDGPARILELPLMLGAGETPITVALTRIAAYTGPGEYELQAVATGGGIPDMLPAIDVGGRSFGLGEGSAARVTVAADGSGLLAATGLVETASLQVSAPDPTARVDLAMQWTCQGQ
ncbi:MAG: hypothetical protein ACOYYS_04535 [Chloroflexota bacterium]